MLILNTSIRQLHSGYQDRKTWKHYSLPRIICIYIAQKTLYVSINGREIQFWKISIWRQKKETWQGRTSQLWLLEPRNRQRRWDGGGAGHKGTPGQDPVPTGAYGDPACCFLVIIKQQKQAGAFPHSHFSYQLWKSYSSALLLKVYW